MGFRKSFFYLLLLTTLISTSAYAASVRVDFDIPYKKGFFKKTPNDKFRGQAMERALSEIWKKYQVRLDSSKLADIERSRAAVEERLGDLITDVTIIEEKVDEKSLMVSYTVRGTVNDTLLTTIIGSLQGDMAEAGDGGAFAFMFVAREQSSVTENDATVQKRTQARAAAERKRLKENISEDVATDDGKEYESEEVTEGEQVTVGSEVKSSGSTKRDTPVDDWRLIPSQGVDAEVTKALVEAGYGPIHVDELLAADCAESNMEDEVEASDLIDDLMSSGKLSFSRKNRRTVNKAMKECEAVYFGYGYMDVDSVMQDPQSGGWAARVSVRAQVMYYKNKLPSREASVQESLRQIGTTYEEARDKALREAGRKVGEIITSQLRAKGLQ